MKDTPICPCEGFTHPAILFNPPGRKAIAYRVGDYIRFRRALLQSRKDETELTQWRPDAQDDLAVQLVEWWAYLADILTFYNERIANESYLRTANLPESLQQLIRVLGYRPRPGIGSQGMVAALVTSSKSLTLPQGFQIQSKPKPGKQPQIFELDADTLVKPLDAVAATPIASPKLLAGAGVLLKGSITTVKPDDQLLLLEKGWSGTSDRYALVSVQQVQPEKDPAGNTNTRVIFTSTPALANATAQEFRLLKSNQSAYPWQYTTAFNVVLGSNSVHLEAIARQVKVGDPILFEMPKVSNPVPKLVSVTQYTEVVWYTNGDPANPSQSPTPPLPENVPLIPIPHTKLSFTPSLSNNWDIKKMVVRYDWQDVGQLIATPASTFDSNDPRIAPANAIALPTGSQRPILLEDANEQGILAQATQGSPSPVLQLFNFSQTTLDLKPPLRLLLNLLPVSRGQTVANEVLGSGNASFAGQEFTLSKSPLTYLLAAESLSGKDYKSTLRIWVNDIEWQEVPSFYGQPADARIFVTREDAAQKTHILFGDGVNGARLPTGSNNVVAKYRYGSGQEAPAAGTLTVIAKPYPNLKAIRNPVAVGGGADPDPPEQIRRYAPRSVLTFDRAVSGDDYEAIAAQAPGVARARAYWTWDAAQQRSLVVVYVGDDASAVTAATTALRNASDPNRPLLVKKAVAISIKLNLTVQIQPAYTPSPVLAAVKAALLDAERGLFGAGKVRIGQSVYQSQIYAACLGVPGVVAVHGLKFWRQSGDGFVLDSAYRHDPGEGKFYQLSTVEAEVSG